MKAHANEPAVYAAILTASAFVGSLVYIALSPINSAAAVAVTVVAPLLCIVCLTWTYRAVFKSIVSVNETAHRSRVLVHEFVNDLSIEQAGKLAHAAINADMLITRPAQAGLKPELPYGYPDDVRAVFREFASVCSSTGSLRVELHAAPTVEPGTTAIGTNDHEALIIDTRSHCMYRQSKGGERQTIESVWHWLLLNTIELGSLRHDLRDALRGMHIDPPHDPHAPADPPPLTTADSAERKQRR